jgi:FeS assembly SUF system regulator
MIKLGKLTDYAVAVMVQLSKEGEGAACSAHQLAKKTGIPEPTVAKVLKKLAGQKLVVSVRGAAGGYKLAQAEKAYSLCDVIEAMDGPILVVSCVDGEASDCKAEDRCPAHGLWEPVNEAIRATLQKIALSEMAIGGCHVPYDFINAPLQPARPAAGEEKAG